MSLSSKYRFLTDLGSGGMADVHLAVAQGPSGFNKLVVLKLMRRGLVEDPEFVHMFLNEARLAARLNHPHVVQTYESGQEDGRPMIVMEHLEGQPLSALLARGSQCPDGLPVHLGLRIIADALSGLHYAHELRDFDGTPLEIVHRDATPHNIFVTFDGQVKVLDFGIAKARSSCSDTRAGVVKGKLQYMAPEQLGGLAVDRRADIFAMGVVLWEVLTGRRLWLDCDAAMGRMVLDGQILRPSVLKPLVAPPLEAMCMKALAMDPADRFQTAAEFESAIEAFLAEQGEQASAKELGRLVSELFTNARQHLQQLLASQANADAPTPFAELSVERLDNERSEAKTVVRSDGLGETTTSAVTGMRATDRPGFRGVAAAASAGVVGLAVIVFLLQRHADSHTTADMGPPPDAAAVTLAAPSAHPSSSAPAMVRLSIRTNPREAKVFLDGSPLDVSQELVRASDSAAHILRAELAHYGTKEIAVVFDRDANILLNLDAATAARPADRARPVAKSTAAASASAPVTADCSFPWDVDGHGIKRVRLECL